MIPGLLPELHEMSVYCHTLLTAEREQGLCLSVPVSLILELGLVCSRSTNTGRINECIYKFK